LGIGSAWWSDEQDGLWITHRQKAPLKEEYLKGEVITTGGKTLKVVEKTFSKFFSANRITASAVVTQVGNRNWQILVPTEKGKQLIYEKEEINANTFTFRRVRNLYFCGRY